VLIGAADDEFLQAAKERGKSSAAAKSYDAEAAERIFDLERRFFMVRFWAEEIAFSRKRI